MGTRMSFNLQSVLSSISKQKALCAGRRRAELGGGPSLGQAGPGAASGAPAARTRTPQPAPELPAGNPREGGEQRGPEAGAAQSPRHGRRPGAPRRAPPCTASGVTRGRVSERRRVEPGGRGRGRLGPGTALWPRAQGRRVSVLSREGKASPLPSTQKIVLGRKNQWLTHLLLMFHGQCFPSFRLQLLESSIF